MSLLAVAVLGGMVAVPAGAEYPWRVLGQREIHGESGDRQVIDVAGDRRFIAMRLCVRRQGVSFRQVDVRFQGGDSQTFRIRGVVPNQRCTGDIALRDGHRALAEVAISYDSSGLNARGARLQLHAR
ncbi:MAG TPA: hypothetical protein VMG08_08135 [Allosphingosinicella sp.]|nr:hypothetical protein [Allosphingosinicella sp.]